MSLLNKFPRTLRWILLIAISFLVLMTLYRFLFFFAFRPEGRPLPGSAFILGLRYDLRVAGIVALVMWLLTMVRIFNPFLNKLAAKIWIVVLSLAFGVWLIFYTTDFYHYDYLHARLNGSVLNFLADAQTSFQMMQQSYPVFGGLALLVLAMWLWVRWMKFGLHRATQWKVIGKKRHRLVLHTTFFVLIAIAIFGRVGQFPLRWSDAYRFGDEFKAAVALNPFQSFASTLKFRNSGFNEAEVKKYYPDVAKYLRVPVTDSSSLSYMRMVNFTDTAIVKPNVVLVICESYSAYKSSMYGNPLDPSPYFDSLSKHGLFYPRCFTPATGTARGIWALITGIPDVERPKTASRNPFAVDQHSILNDFKVHEKLYFLGGSTSWANIRGLLTNNLPGIRIYEQEHFRSEQEDVWGISDKNLFLEANQILAKRKEPFFAVIQTANNHRPYTIPDEDLATFTKVRFPTDSLKKYGFDNNDELNAFRYMDYCIEQYMKAAQKENYFSNTLFVFIGDHGIRGNAGPHFPAVYTTHGLSAVNVPLLFYYPEHIQPQRDERVCSQMDVLPTIAGLLRQPYRNTTFGFNLLEAQKHYAFIADPDINTIGLVADSFYFVRHPGGREEFVSMVNNESVPLRVTQSVSDSLRRLKTGLFETARYLLLNNKKQNSSVLP